MAKKIDISLDDIKKNLETGKLIYSTNNVMKNIRSGNVVKVFITKNCPKDVKTEIEHMATLGEFEILDIDITNEELGNICKKPYSISVIGLRG